MTKPTRLLLTFLAALAALSLDVRAGEHVGQLDLLVGPRALDDDFEPADDPLEIGLALSLGKPEWPVLLAVDLSVASGDGDMPVVAGGLPATSTADVDIHELDLGVRRYFGERTVGYVGGGAAWVRAEVEVGLDGAFTGKDDGSELGLWAGGGLRRRFGNGFQVGLDGRYTKADVELFGDNSYEAGGLRLAATVGMHW